MAIINDYVLQQINRYLISLKIVEFKAKGRKKNEMKANVSGYVAMQIMIFFFYFSFSQILFNLFIPFFCRYAAYVGK